MHQHPCPLILQEEIMPILDRITIFAGLSPAHLLTVFSLLSAKQCAPQEIIFQQGDPASHIYIIKSGRVGIYAVGNGQRYELISFDTGHCFGETSVIGIQAHSATAVTLEPTQLLILSRQALLSIFDRDKELFGLLILNIAREACRRLHKSDEILLHYFLEKNNSCVH